MNAADIAALFVAERERQIAVEGWTPEHDDAAASGDLALAAASYTLPRAHRQLDGNLLPLHWPWLARFWKPTPDDRQRELVKAGALLIAEIERLQRRA